MTYFELQILDRKSKKKRKVWLKYVKIYPKVLLHCEYNSPAPLCENKDWNRNVDCRHQTMTIHCPVRTKRVIP